MFGIKTIAFTILFKTAQCAMSTLYALENAQVSDKKVLLNLMQCGRLNQKFETAALQFSAIDATECVSLSSSWYDSSVYESGFGYAIKKHNVEDFSEIGGMRASIGKFFERRLPLPFETGIIINIDLVPYFGNALKVSIKTESNAYFIHLVFNQVENRTVVQDRADPNGTFNNMKTFQGCSLTNGIKHTLSLTLQKGSTLKVMLDGQELLKYDSVVNPSLARKVAFWFGTSADYAMIRRIEVTKNP